MATAKRSVVSLWLTGAGVDDQMIADGTLGPLEPPFPRPVLGIGATFTAGTGQVQAPVLFAGQAPGLVAGVVQVNVQIPTFIDAGRPLLTIHIGNYATANLLWVR